MLAADMQPTSVVEDEGFQKFVTLLDSRYEIPSRRTLMRMLLEMYEKVKATVEWLLSQIGYGSLTTNIWTLRATQSCLTLTAHFLYSLLGSEEHRA